VIAAFAITLIAWVVSLFAGSFPKFSDLVNSTASTFLRVVTSYLSYPLPFSLFEAIVLLLVPVLTAVTVIVFRGAKSSKELLRSLFSLLGVASLFMSGYILSFGVAYHTSPLSAKLGIENISDISEEELYEVTVKVRDEVNRLSFEVDYSDSEGIMPYSLDELSEKLSLAYTSVSEKYPFFYNFNSRVKPITFSGVMSDLGLTGIYTFYTGEANINTAYPDYNLPFTAAHELAHQRGIARENEANFMAFLVCSHSDDAFIRYSGYLNLYEYLASALYSTDSELYKTVHGELNENARLDIKASSSITLEHRDSFLYKLSHAVNDTYLKLNGTEGSVSYGYVVRLAVSYFRE